jgi:hypothetical protein
MMMIMIIIIIIIIIVIYVCNHMSMQYDSIHICSVSQNYFRSTSVF